MKMPFQERIEHYIESGFQAIYIPTAERSRCEEELSVVARKLEMTFVTWDGINGFTVFDDEGGVVQTGKDKDAIEALMSLDINDDAKTEESQWKKKNVLFVMRNLNMFLEDGGVRQLFQNLYYGRKLSNKYKRPLIIMANAMQIHPEISPCITLAEFSLPDEVQLGTVFSEIADNIEIDESRPGAIAKYTEEGQSRIIQAMRGLTTLEAENVLAYSLRVNRGFAPSLVDTIEDQKAAALEKSEVLTYVPKDRIASMDDIGGYEELKSFISERKLSYTKKARELGMDLPRGIVLLGIPGTGKSIVGKIIAKELGLPLVVFDVSAIFGSLVGQSEQRVRTALQTVDALDGAVMLIDEAEKGLGGADQSVGDSGVSRRVFGVILSWLTDKTSRTFVVMTMNRTRGIPSEFLRKGRVDEIFCTDIPDEYERDQILRIHCRKRKVDTTKLKAAEWAELIDNTKRFVGAELEQIVIDARFKSFAARGTGQPTAAEFLAAIESVVPIADREKENIDEIRRACEHARPVSRKREPVAANSTKGSRVVSVR